MSEVTKGYELERRAHRLAWNLGYFSRRQIILYSDGGNSITDIDVIGMKFDEILSSDVLLIETKSEKGFASILKLKGLLEYFTTKSAFMIRPNITPDIIRFSEKLNINALHTSRLDEIEDSLNIDADDWSLSYSAEYDSYKDELLMLLEKAKFRDEIALLNDFWEEQDSYSSMKSLISAINFVRARYDAEKDGEIKNSLAFLLSEYISLFSVSLLKSAGILYKYPTHQRSRIFHEKLISGKLPFREKEDLLDKFFSFLKSYTKSLGKKMMVKREDLTLLPIYHDDLYSLINNFIDLSRHSRILPLITDIMSSCIIEQKELNKKYILKYYPMIEESYDVIIDLLNQLVGFLFPEIPVFLKNLL